MIPYLRYSKYAHAHAKEMADMEANVDLELPHDVVYSELPMLKAEEVSKLELVRPKTLADARKIQGVNPSSLIMLHKLAKKAKRKSQRGGPA